MENEVVDILLATYNGEKYLRAQLDSILNQTYKNFRLLISDDCSTDSTREILEEYKAKDNRIELFMQRSNQGVIRNFEFLLKKVKNDLYMFSDQDDIWKEEKIEKSINKMKEENADLVYSDLEVVDSDLNVTYESYWKLKGIYSKIKKYNNFESLYLNNFITGCTILSKKEFINEILPFPSQSKFVLHDYWVALVVSQLGKISYVEEPLIKYRQHKNNSVGSKKRSSELDSFDEIRKLFIEVKIQHFNVFVANDEKFKTEKLRKLNRKSLNYYEMISKKNYINLRNWPLFFKLYKYEEFKYTIENFVILNLPIFGRLGFKFLKLIKKK